MTEKIPLKNRIKIASEEIVDEIIKSNINTQNKLNTFKKQISKKYELDNPLTNIEILNNLSQDKINLIKNTQNNILTTKPIRTSSGVAIVAIMSYPYKCPHGKCSTCPGGPNSEFGDVPQSYTGNEPATIRAIRNGYDPYLQVMNRLEQYVILNQIPEKVELIIMGGTFPSFPKKYQIDFVKNAFKAMNDFSKTFFKKQKNKTNKSLNNISNNVDIDRKIFNNFFELPGKINNKIREESIRQKLLILKNKTKTTLETEQKYNEISFVKCVGLTVETRPDYADKKIGNFLLKLGCTRIELGIQSVYEKQLIAMNRGHTLTDSINSIKTLKELGFKLNFHYMLGLPGWNYSSDLKGLKTLFSNKDFMPDMLKIYPCMVLKGTELFKKWEQKKFTPIDTVTAAKIIAEFKPYVPEFCRIMRVQRDIPTKMTVAGVDKTNLRQYVDQLKPICRCIRCREISHVFSKKKILPSKIDIIVREYNASDGKEFFISAEDIEKDILIGFIRLRFPEKQLRKEITKKTALIRELHVYGKQVSLGKFEFLTGEEDIQHKGFGKQLLKKAETIAKENEYNKIVIISGIGVREYYRKLGYKKQGPYMVKII